MLKYPSNFNYLRIETNRLTIVIDFEIEQVAVAAEFQIANARYCSLTYLSLHKDKVDFGVNFAFAVAAGDLYTID